MAMQNGLNVHQILRRRKRAEKKKKVKTTTTTEKDENVESTTSDKMTRSTTEGPLGGQKGSMHNKQLTMMERGDELIEGVAKKTK